MMLLLLLLLLRVHHTHKNGPKVLLGHAESTLRTAHFLSVIVIHPNINTSTSRQRPTPPPTGKTQEQG